MTKQRILIKTIIEHAEAHLNAQQIYELAKQELPSTVMATVYNNLNALCDSKDIRRIKIEGRVDLYEHMEKSHDHTICDCCGKIDDLYLNGISDYLQSEYKMEVLSYDLTIHDVCDTCKSRNTLRRK